MERYDIKNYIQLFANVESLLTLATEITKLRCFLSWQLSSWGVIKNCL